MNPTKPPLGPTPMKIWLAHRIEELSRSINAYILFDDRQNMDSIDEWSCELKQRVFELKKELSK